jgi:Fur family ferric uptake transcriptional regulator
MDVTMACQKVFLERLHRHGLRLTPQREMVLSVMHQVEGVATAEEIHNQIQALSSAVDISTVYRTLGLLRELGLVACIDAGEQHHQYQLVGVHGPHLHLACRSCGAIVGVELDALGPLTTDLQAVHGFEVDLSDVTIPGLCRDCRSI